MEPTAKAVEVIALQRERDKLRERLLSPFENHLDLRIRLAFITQRLVELEDANEPPS